MKTAPEDAPGVVILKAAHSLQRFNEAIQRTYAEDKRQRELNKAINRARARLQK